MKTRILMALPLMAALAVPGVAQTTSSSAPADQNAQTTSTSSKDDQVSTRQPLQYESHEGFWGKINPFARKKYVNRQLDPVRGRVNELDELTAQNSKMIKDVDARATEGIRLASAKANEADMHAVDAGNRAQAAHQTIQQANTKLNSVEQVVGNIDQYQPVTQAEIRFRSGQTVLSKNAKQALDEMATPLKDQKGYIIEVQGFSSGKGMTAVQNSQHMAEAVVRYLAMNHDIPIYRIYTVGMGNAPAPATAEGEKPRRTAGGRVEVSVLKNGIGDLNQSASATPASSSSMSGQGMSNTTTTQGTTTGTMGSSSSSTTTTGSDQQNSTQPQDQTNPK
ncbi:MAG: OmpA family protein [Acidobacteriaceae bacterium]|nr:OmpA family protein [Acidobacteriaceae bacterium]